MAVQKVETKVVEQDREATVEDFINLLQKVDPKAILSIKIDMDLNEEESSMKLSDLRNNMHTLKEDYPFSSENNISKNYLVIDAFEF